MIILQLQENELQTKRNWAIEQETLSTTGMQSLVQVSPFHWKSVYQKQTWPPSVLKWKSFLHSYLEVLILITILPSCTHKQITNFEARGFCSDTIFTRKTIQTECRRQRRTIQLDNGLILQNVQEKCDFFLQYMLQRYQQTKQLIKNKKLQRF